MGVERSETERPEASETIRTESNHHKATRRPSLTGKGGRNEKTKMKKFDYKVGDAFALTGSDGKTYTVSLDRIRNTTNGAPCYWVVITRDDRPAGGAYYFNWNGHFSGPRQEAQDALEALLATFAKKDF